MLVDGAGRQTDPRGDRRRGQTAGSEVEAFPLSLGETLEQT
jgi:hypothetical protein